MGFDVRLSVSNESSRLQRSTVSNTAAPAVISVRTKTSDLIDFGIRAINYSSKFLKKEIKAMTLRLAEDRGQDAPNQIFIFSTLLACLFFFLAQPGCLLMIKEDQRPDF